MPGSATRAAVGSSSLMTSSLLVRLERCPYASKLSFRDRRRRGPESMNTGLWNMDSGLAALPRPGMTARGSCGVVGRLLNGRRVPGEGRAAHVADLVAGVEAAGAMHHLAVVPHDEIARPPGVRVDQLGLCVVLGQVAQEHARIGHRPTLDRPGMLRQKQRFAAGHGMAADEALAHRPESRHLLR